MLTGALCSGDLDMLTGALCSGSFARLIGALGSTAFAILTGCCEVLPDAQAANAAYISSID